jgi:hypothetical protein
MYRSLCERWTGNHIWGAKPLEMAAVEARDTLARLMPQRPQIINLYPSLPISVRAAGDPSGIGDRLMNEDHFRTVPSDFASSSEKSPS